MREVLASHILKQTGSYKRTSYAIQDTLDMVAQHYGRLLPQDKAEIAAGIINKVWEAASEPELDPRNMLFYRGHAVHLAVEDRVS